MRIHDIGTYLDGGSIEFTVDDGVSSYHVWLETPFRGEPRSLLIDSRAMAAGDGEVTRLLADIARWWTQLPPQVRETVLALSSRDAAASRPVPDSPDTYDFSCVIAARDYVSRVYAR